MGNNIIEITRIIVLILFVLSFGCHKIDNRKLKSPEIVFNDTEVDFGNIPLNSHKSFDFIYTNNGKSSLKLFNVETSCPCMMLKWSSKPIGEGENGTIHVIYAPRYYGHFKDLLKIHSNASDSVVALTVTGRIVE